MYKKLVAVLLIGSSLYAMESRLRIKVQNKHQKTPVGQEMLNKLDESEKSFGCQFTKDDLEDFETVGRVCLACGTVVSSCCACPKMACLCCLLSSFGVCGFVGCVSRRQYKQARRNGAVSLRVLARK